MEANMTGLEKIAKILRTDKSDLGELEKKLFLATGKSDVLQKISDENDAAIEKSLKVLSLNRSSSAQDIYKALISKIEADDNLLFEALKRPAVKTVEGCETILKTAEKVVKPPKGFFLKIEKAKEILIKTPPPKLLEFFGHSSVEKMLEKENILEIFCALRFIEGSKWLNEVFLPTYQVLKLSDFEEREIQTFVVSQKTATAAAKFVEKKYHNISHLKELGVIFMIPVSLGISGELIRNFSLVLHYFYEVSFYSSIFKSLPESDFSADLVSLLQGRIIEQRLPISDRSQWLIVQRYLAKDDENEWRLFEPHLNPEAIHWEKAERSLIRAGSLLDGFSPELSFWKNLNWVGDYFKTENDDEILTSFNLVDTAMALVKEKELIKYLYHHQEALWNKIFSEYFGEEKMEKMIKENIIKGWLEI